MSPVISLLDAAPFETRVSNAIHPEPLREQFGKTVARLQTELAREHGVTAHLSGNFDALGLLAAAHKGEGLELMPMMVPTVAPKTVGQWVALCQGERVVATTAAIYFYIGAGTSLRDRIRDMSLFYASPHMARTFGAWADCSAPIAQHIAGHICLLSAGWVHPEFRGKRLIERAVRLAGLAGFAAWRPDWVCGLIEHKISMRLVADSYGFPRRESDVNVQIPGWDGLRFTLGASQRAEYESLCVGYRPGALDPTTQDDERARQYWARLRTNAAALSEAAE